MKIDSYEIFAKGSERNEVEFLSFSETVLFSTSATVTLTIISK